MGVAIASIPQSVWWIGMIVVALVLLLLVAALSSRLGSRAFRAERDLADADNRQHYDSESQFKRPSNEGDLL